MSDTKVMDSDKDIIDFLGNVPDVVSSVISKYEKMLQEIQASGKLKLHELETFYEKKIEDLNRILKQTIDSLEGDKLVREELLVELQQKLNELQELYDSKMAELEALKEQCKKDIEVHENTIAEKQQIILQKIEEVQSLETQTQTIATRYDLLKLEKATLDVQLESSSGVIITLKENISTLLKDKEKLEADLVDKKKELALLKESENVLVMSLDSLKAKEIESAKTLSRLLEENKAMKERLEKLDAVSALSKKLLEEHSLKGIGSSRGIMDEVTQLKITLNEKDKEIASLTGQLAILKAQEDSVRQLKHVLEKDRMQLRVQVEAEIRKKNLLQQSVSMPIVPPMTISAPEPETIKVLKKTPARTSIKESSSMETMSESPKSSRRKSMGRQYYGDIKPFTEDLLVTRSSQLLATDFSSIEELANAVAQKLLKCEGEQASYICKDLENKKCEYVDKKGSWTKDHKLSLLKKILLPLLQKMASNFLSTEKQNGGDEKLIASLLQRLDEFSHGKDFWKKFKNYVIPQISYVVSV